MGGLSWWHWLIIIAVFILLFGARKLPDAARGLGRSLRILKSEVNAMHDDDAQRKGATPAETDQSAQVATPTPQIAAAPAQPVQPVQPVAVQQPVQPAQPVAVQQPVTVPPAPQPAPAANPIPAVQQDTYADPTRPAGS